MALVVKMTDKYQRAVASYLRDSYGISPGRPIYSGRHPTFQFTYRGTPRIVTLNAPGHPGENLLALKLQDIRRELGPPPQVERRPKMRLADMLPEATATSMEALASGSDPIVVIPTKMEPEKIRLSVACYEYPMLRLSIDKEVAERVFGGSAFTVEDHGPWTWAFKKNPN